MIVEKMMGYEVVIDGKYYAQEEIENYVTPFRETVFKEGIFYAV